VLSLALRGTTILAGTDDGIFERRPDQSAWTRVRVSVDGREAHPRVTDLVALPEARLVAATPDGVLSSADGGRTWTRPALGAEAVSARDGAEIANASAEPEAGGTPEEQERSGSTNDPSEVFDLALSHRGLVMVAARSGFFLSRDGGETWRRVGDPLSATPHTIVFSPSDERVLYATTTGGLFRSKDEGATWHCVSGGLPHSDLTGIALTPDGRTLYASDFTWGGVFRSADGGSTWSRMPLDGLGSDRVWTLGVDPGAPERVLAGAAAGGLHVLGPSTLGQR
jgi:photosystem II stability/assembly factor-like uncharacterized protein